MALSILTPTTNATGTDDYESDMPDDILANELFGEESERHFRPSLADRLQIGFLRSDHATQTEESEIPEIKSLTSTVQELVTELGYTKKDLHFSKRVIIAKYNRKLEDTTLKLHTQLQEKITEIERLHEERVSVARRSFKQQLQDALIKMSEKYKKYYEDKLAGKLKPTASTLERKSKVVALETEVERCQSIIEMLEIQVEDLRKEIEAKDSTTKIIMDTEELDAANEQNNELLAEINQLTAQVDELSDSIEFRDDKIRSLNRELADSREEAEKEREMSRKLAKNVEDLKSDIEKNHESWKSEVGKMKSSIQENMAGEMKKQMDAQKSLLADQERAALFAEKEKQRLLEEERRKYELLLAKERENTERVRQESHANRAFEGTLEQQRNEISVLKNRLSRTNKQWEKKFTVLRSSLHALKDESYVRQQLQKQSATLKYASISYGTDFVPAQPQSAAGLPLRNNGILNPNKPLPGIRGDSGKQAFETTNTLPSGPGTEIFATGVIDSADEQEMEEYVRGFVPLPSPPNWQKYQFGEYMPSIDQNNTTS